jgi:pentatricopeptide repeat protein
MSTPETKDQDLASLETSLDAVEQENTHARLLAKYGDNPTWVFYYVAFLGLTLVIIILAILNFAPKPEEPVFLSLEQTSNNPIVQPLVEEVSVEAEAVPIEETSTTPIEPKSKAEVDKYTYRLFTPEELQKIANQIISDNSDESDATKAEVFSFLGWYSNLQKMKKDGMDFAVKALKADNQNKKNQRAMAMAYIANGLFEKAKVILSAYKDEKDSFKEWMDGYLQIEAGRMQGGMAKLEQIRKSDPSFYPAAYILIQQYLKQNQFSKAYEIAQFWKKKSLFNVQFVHLMAEVLDKQQQYIELVNYLTPFDSTYPKDWVILYYLGKGNTKLQKRDVAKTYFKKVLDSQENYLVEQIGQANYEMGKIELYENNYKQSISHLLQASQRLPNDTSIRFYLASAYFKGEDYEKAIEIYQQMLLKDQNDPKIRIYLAMAYFELGQFQTAEKNLLLVLNQGSDEPLLLYYLAKIEDQKGNLPKAKEYLLAVLRVEPKHPLATKMLEKINSMIPAESAPATEAPSAETQN